MTMIRYVLLLMTIQFKRTATNMSLVNGEVSHDQITRLLTTDGFGKKQLESITKPRNLRRGHLIIDDTILEKPYGEAFQEASYVYSSTKGKAVFGYQVVLLVWTNGKKRIVIDYRVYRRGGPSKIDLALEMLSYAKHRLCLQPEFVLFDSWYASKRFLQRLQDYRWYFVTRLKKNRSLDGKQLKEFKRNPRWHEAGRLAGGLKVSVVKHDNKYFATNRLSLSRTEILKTYKIRQHIEEVNKQLKFIGMSDCHMRSIKAQKNHITCCVIAFALVEKASIKNGTSVYKTLKRIMSGKEQISNADIAALSRAA